MRIKAFFIFLLFIFVCSLPHSADAFLLEEQQISSKDGTCKMRYLTEKNAKGWHFVANQLNCPNDGWLDGYHDITIFDAFSQPTEKIYGYFSYGYWTGDAFVDAPFLTRFSEELGVQKATFLLAKDDLNDMDYIGQMVATKNQNGDYGSFHVCDPFRLLIVTEQIPAFANKKRQQLIFKNIEKHVRTICPVADKVMLFVSPVIEPKQEDIVFYSEIDLKNHTSKNTWQEEALKKSGHYSKTIEIANLEDVISPKEKDLDALREALTKKIDLLPFKNVTEKKHSTSFSDTSFSEQKEDLLTNKNDLTETPVPVLKTNHLVAFDTFDENIETPKNDPKNQEKETDLFSFPLPQKSYHHKESIELENHPIAHQCVLSKVKKAPVDVNFIGFVSSNSNKASFITKPLPLIVQGKVLKTGWYKISGSLNANNPPPFYRGTIKATSIQSCKNESCEVDK